MEDTVMCYGPVKMTYGFSCKGCDACEIRKCGNFYCIHPSTKLLHEQERMIESHPITPNWCPVNGTWS